MTDNERTIYFEQLQKEYEEKCLLEGGVVDNETIINIIRLLLNKYDEECLKVFPERQDMNAIDAGRMIHSLVRLIRSKTEDDRWTYGKILVNEINYYISPKATDEKTLEKRDAEFKHKNDEYTRIENELKELHNAHFKDNEGFETKFFNHLRIFVERIVLNVESIWQTLEGITLPIIDLLRICEQSKDIVIKSYGKLNKSIDLDSSSASLLSVMIREYLANRKREFDKYLSPKEIEKILVKWKNEKTDLDNDKYLAGKFLKHCMNEIEWEEAHNITDKRVISYSIGAIVGLYVCDENKNRKERADFVKNKINAYNNHLSKK